MSRNEKGRQDAKQALLNLAAGQLEECHNRLEQYSEWGAIQRNRLAAEDRQGRAQVIREVLSDADCNFSKMHQLSNCISQIKDFARQSQ